MHSEGRVLDCVFNVLCSDKLHVHACTCAMYSCNLCIMDMEWLCTVPFAGVIDVVCDCSRRNNLLCLQIVRSLCCYSPIKSLIASNGMWINKLIFWFINFSLLEKVIDILETSLKSDNHHVVFEAALAVWSLLYNSIRVSKPLTFNLQWLCFVKIDHVVL